MNPIGKNITKGNLINVVWITRKFTNMYLCQDGLPIDKSPLFKGYDKMDSEFMNRDNRMRYTMARPHDNFWSNSNPRVTWNGDAADLASASIKILSRMPVPDIIIRNGLRSVPLEIIMRVMIFL